MPNPELGARGLQERDWSLCPMVGGLIQRHKLAAMGTLRDKFFVVPIKLPHFSWTYYVRTTPRKNMPHCP